MPFHGFSFSFFLFSFRMALGWCTARQLPDERHQCKSFKLAGTPSVWQIRPFFCRLASNDPIVWPANLLGVFGQSLPNSVKEGLGCRPHIHIDWMGET